MERYRAGVLRSVALLFCGLPRCAPIIVSGLHRCGPVIAYMYIDV